MTFRRALAARHRTYPQTAPSMASWRTKSWLIWSSWRERPWRVACRPRKPAALLAAASEESNK